MAGVFCMVLEFDQGDSQGCPLKVSPHAVSTGEGQQKNVGNGAGQKSRSKIKGDSYNDKVIIFR